MVVDDLNFAGVAAVPNETDTELPVDTNTVLPGTIPAEKFEAIPWRRSQVTQRCSVVQDPQLSMSDSKDAGRKPPHRQPIKYARRISARKAANHLPLYNA